MAEDLLEHETALRAIVTTERGDVVSILQAVQRLFGWLPRPALEYVAEHAGIPPARLWSVASFYSSFYLKPRGRTIIRVCEGTACHVRGAARISDALVKHLRLGPDRGTTEDLEYTLDGVACVGCCSLAPVVTIDGEVFGKLGQLDAVKLIEEREERAVPS